MMNVRVATLGIILCLLGSPAGTDAQDREPQTLIRGGIDTGGFGGPVLKFSDVDERFGVLLGFRGGWIIDHTFVVGAGIYGLANTDNFQDVNGPAGAPEQLYMGYGGLEMEWIISSHRIVHVSLQGLIGAGGLGFDNPDYECCTDENSDGFVVAEPGINVMVNVHKVFRLGLGGSYRFIGGVNLAEMTNERLSGPAGTLTLKFGAF